MVWTEDDTTERANARRVLTLPEKDACDCVSKLDHSHRIARQLRSQARHETQVGQSWPKHVYRGRFDTRDGVY